MACESGHKSVADLLIHKAAKVNYQDNVRFLQLSKIMMYSLSFQIGFTPLHLASQNGHLDVVGLLIERDAQINVPAKVYMQQSSNLVVYLYMQEESHCITALGLACEAGYKAVAEQLILKGANFNHQDDVRLVEPSRVMMHSIIISDWFHTAPLGKSKWSLGCGRIVN